MKYTFGDIVIVEGTLIGVIVKSWIRTTYNKPDEIKHEVYVRNYNKIIEYPERKISRYLVRHKELNEEELEYQYNSENNL